MKWSLRQQLFALGIIPVPLSMLLAASLTHLKEDVSEYLTSKAISEKTSVISATSNIVHAVQKERGKSVSFLNGGAAYADVETEISTTNSKFQALADLAGPVGDAQKALSNLREGVKAKTVSGQQAFTEYSAVVGTLLNFETQLASAARGTDLETEMMSVIELETAKEGAGRLRAGVTAALASNKPIEEDRISILVSAKGTVDANLNSSTLDVSQKTKEGIAAFQNNPAWREVNRVFQHVLRHASEGNYGLAPKEYFAQATAAIDLLAEFVQTEVNVNKTRCLEDQASRMKTASLMAFLSILLLVALAASVWILSQMVSRSIGGIAADLHEGATRVGRASSELTTNSERIASSANQSATAIQETSAAIEEISKMISQSSENAGRVQALTEENNSRAEIGRKVMTEMRASIESIRGSQDQMKTEVDESNTKINGVVALISEIKSKTGVINDIVFQTKLLSFNASVEAARAGEHGRGFAVVAEEVGNLARMSGVAAAEISEMLERSSREVGNAVDETTMKLGAMIDRSSNTIDEGLRVSEKLAGVFDEMTEGIDAVTTMVAEMATANREQSAAVEQVSTAISQLNQANMENATSSREAADSALGLRHEVARLESVVESLGAVVNVKEGNFAAVLPKNVVPFSRAAKKKVA